jgi:hypothetical protein
MSLTLLEKIYKILVIWGDKMKNLIKKTMLLICIILMYSCIDNGKNVAETLEIKDVENVSFYVGEYLSIYSIYNGTDILQSIRTRTLDAKSGELISQTPYIFPEFKNNTVQKTEELIASNVPSFGKNIIQEDNVLINYYAEEFINSNYDGIDLLYVIHIDKINGYFIISISNIKNKLENNIFFNVYHYANDLNYSITSRN